MGILKRKEVSSGLEVQLRDDGHWMHFETKSQYASICVEAKFGNTQIIKKAIIEWIDEQLK